MPAEQPWEEPTPPGAAARLVDDGWEPLEHTAGAEDPLRWPGYPELLQRARVRTGRGRAVTTGRASIAGWPCLLISFEFGFLGGSVGEIEGGAITDALAVATAERLPVVSVLSSGGARMQEGMRSLVQMQRISAALAELARAGVPHICVAAHPTTGGVWASLGASADLIIGVQGAAVAFAGSRVQGQAAGVGGTAFTAEGKWRQGFVDFVEPLAAARLRLAAALEFLSPATRGKGVTPPLPAALGSTSALSGWAQVERARSLTRPRSAAYLDDYFTHRLEIRGDRVGGVDPEIRCGFGRRGGATIAFVAQSGGPTTAAGYRTARRLFTLATKFGLPVLTLIDTPGSANDKLAEESGVGTAIAELLQTMATTRVPVVSVVIGQGGSGGALAIAAPDNLWITPDGYFSVIAPEAAASILKASPSEVPGVADLLHLAPEDLVELGVVRGILGTQP